MNTTTTKEARTPGSDTSIDLEKPAIMASCEDVRLMDINETGHVQELERNFSLLSVCSVGIVTGNCWVAFGGSLVFAIYNGGPPGVLFEFIAAASFYFLITASLAELASSMPSSAGVYHWASITPGSKYGPICGWFAGWWNTCAWVCGGATMSNIAAQVVVSMYGVYHPGFKPERWTVFIPYLIITWTCCATVLFANKFLPTINTIGLVFIVGGVIITTVVCAVTPSTNGVGHAPSSFVWSNWSNESGWPNNGFVFLIGMLNGAFAIGTPDCVAHLAEEIPQPKRNVPLAMASQMAFGFVSTLLYAVAMLYAINDLDDVLHTPFFPVARIYAQATASNIGTTALCILIFIPIIGGCIGSYITAGRGLWTLARDGAVPFSPKIAVVSLRFKNPFVATLLCGIFTTILGAVNVASAPAFAAITGSFVVMTTLSYLAAILPFILTRRFSRAGQSHDPFVNNMTPGYFQMGNVVGYTINILSSLYIIVFVVIFCFPTTLPVSAETMNFSSVIVGTVTTFAGLYWLIRGGNYVGPKATARGGDSHMPLGAEILEERNHY